MIFEQFPSKMKYTHFPSRRATIRTAKTREHLRKVLTQSNCEYKFTDNVTEQHKNCPSSASDDRPGRHFLGC